MSIINDIKIIRNKKGHVIKHIIKRGSITIIVPGYRGLKHKPEKLMINNPIRYDEFLMEVLEPYYIRMNDHNESEEAIIADASWKLDNIINKPERVHLNSNMLLERLKKLLNEYYSNINIELTEWLMSIYFNDIWF